MAGFSTGVNALRTLRQIMDLAGQNVANADTEGYHARRASVVTRPGVTRNGVRVGSGSEVTDVERIRSELTERMLIANTQIGDRLEQEVEILDHLEGLLNEPSDNALDAQISSFFDAVSELSGNPDDEVLQGQAVMRAVALTDGFRALAAKLEEMRTNVRYDTEQAVSDVNELTARIAELNGQIQTHEATGVSAPDLKDQRDQLITELSGLINLTTHNAAHGVVNVNAAGTMLVTGNYASDLEAVEVDGELIVRREEAVGHVTNVREGKLAGLLEACNNYIPDTSDRLDELANAFRHAINSIHSTGLGQKGRYESLDGLNAFADDSLAFYETGYDVEQGATETLVLNVEDTTTGDITQNVITVDTTQGANTFVNNLAASINALANVSASVVDDKLQIDAAAGFEFGFATQYDPNPAAPGDITGVPPSVPEIHDAYTGDADLQYDFSFAVPGPGNEVGTDQINITIDVRPAGGGPILRTLNTSVDGTYVPGEAITLENGLKFSLGAGRINAGDSFSMTAYQETDTAGILDALGINTLMNGLGASAIEVTERIQEDPTLLAGSRRELAADNHRLMDMLDVRDEKLLDSGEATLHEYYAGLLSNVGNTKVARDTQFNNLQQTLLNVKNRRDAISGVSVDEEMVKLMDAQRIYQGAVRYLQSVDAMLADLLNSL